MYVCCCLNHCEEFLPSPPESLAPRAFSVEVAASHASAAQRGFVLGATRMAARSDPEPLGTCGEQMCEG